MAVRYDPVVDRFTTFEATDLPKVKPLDIDNYPLFDTPISVPGISGVLDNGNVIAENNLPKMIRDIPEPETITQEKTYKDRKTENVKLTGDQQKNAVYIMNYLINVGKYKPHEAAGIVGNLASESSLNPATENPNDLGLPGGGIAGFRGSNFSALKNFANSRGKSWKDMDTQIDYLLSTINKDVANGLSNSTNPYEASEAWAGYERYAGYNWKLSSARSLQKSKGWSDEETLKWIKNQHNTRGSYAEEIYKLWQSQT